MSQEVRAVVGALQKSIIVTYSLTEKFAVPGIA